MEGFTKIPNWLLDAGLTTSEIGVLIHLLRVQSYREYKGEIKDGWFAKSQNELARECGIKSNHTLTSVLKGIAKNAILEYKSDGKVTYFKINIAENAIPIAKNNIPIAKNTIPIAKNAIPTIAENATQGIAKNANLHKNNIQENLKDIHTQDIVTYNTSNSDISHIENLKEDNKENNIDTVTKVEDNSIPIFPKNFSNSSFFEVVNEFRNNHPDDSLNVVNDYQDYCKVKSSLITPSIDDIRCIAYIENLSFTKEEFKGYYKGCYLNNVLTNISRKMHLLFSKYGFTYNSNDEDIREMFRKYLYREFGMEFSE